jgi:CRP-like cAMP-binding protein
MLNTFSRENWDRRRTVPATDVHETFHVIICDRLQMVQINEETGRMVTLFMLGPGDCFDILQLLNGRPFDGMLEACDDLQLLSLPMDKARGWISTHPDFNRAFLAYLGKQMHTLANLAGDLALHDTETRLAKLLLRHLAPHEPGHNNITLINDLSHEAIAEMIGSVRAVVNRQLQHWRKKGIVSLDHGHIHIEKLEDLLARAHQHLLPPPK